ncbi:MAG: dodecin domain-containing protein [Actinobacteria bacterium]|nr:dodecin domain-containing protein [Actinomycetota bacterium]
MPIEKAIDLVATGPTVDAAVKEALGRASLTLKGLTRFDVQKIEGTFDEGEVSYRVHVRVCFVLKERIHE